MHVPSKRVPSYVYVWLEYLVWLFMRFYDWILDMFFWSDDVAFFVFHSICDFYVFHAHDCRWYSYRWLVFDTTFIDIHILVILYVSALVPVVNVITICYIEYIVTLWTKYKNVCIYCIGIRKSKFTRLDYMSIIAGVLSKAGTAYH